ncbi:MAG: PDZ domain-containing protein [Phycisphaerae bacterium]|nr:PDZ domain-containing protein [Phycisphaerae bacterium]
MKLTSMALVAMVLCLAAPVLADDDTPVPGGAVVAPPEGGCGGCDGSCGRPTVAAEDDDGGVTVTEVAPTVKVKGEAEGDRHVIIIGPDGKAQVSRDGKLPDDVIVTPDLPWGQMPKDMKVIINGQEIKLGGAARLDADDEKGEKHEKAEKREKGDAGVRIIINGQEIKPGQGKPFIIRDREEREERGERRERAERGENMKKFGYLGVSPVPVSEALVDQLGLDDGRGVLLAAVVPNSPAAGAGLAKNDVLTMVDDQVIFSIEQLQKLVAAHKPGTAVRLQFVHKGKLQTARAELGGTERATWKQSAGEEGEEMQEMLKHHLLGMGMGMGGGFGPGTQIHSGQAQFAAPPMLKFWLQGGNAQFKCDGDCRQDCPHKQLGQPGTCGGQCSCKACPMKQGRPGECEAQCDCPMHRKPGGGMMQMHPGMRMPGAPMPSAPAPQGKLGEPRMFSIPTPAPQDLQRVHNRVIESVVKALEPMREDIPPKVWDRIVATLNKMKEAPAAAPKGPFQFQWQ